MTSIMSDRVDSRMASEEAQAERIREKVAPIAALRASWEPLTEEEFQRKDRARYFGRYRITRPQALRLLRRWEKEIIERIEAHEKAPLRILWEVPPIQRLMWQHLAGFFVVEVPQSLPRPISARPAPAQNMVVRDRFPGWALLLAVTAHIALLFISINPATRRAFQKLDELSKNQTITYYKLSEFLPEVFSNTPEKEFPKTAKRIPKQNQTIISNPPEPDNEQQTIIQPDAPKADSLAEIKLPNIISVKPSVVRPMEPPMPTLAPGSIHAINLPKDLLIPVTPALPPPNVDLGKRELADITVADSEALNPQPRLLLNPNTKAPDVEALPPTTFRNTLANVPMPKGPDAVPTVTPEIGRFTNVDAPNLVVLNVNPAPPDKDVQVPNVSRAASFGTEEGTGNGGGSGKSGAMNIPGITVSGGGLTQPGAAVVQTPHLPPQVAANVPPADRTPGSGSRTETTSGPTKPRELNLPKPPRLSTDELTKAPPLGTALGSTKNGGFEREKRIYTTYLNLANLSSQRGSWVMRFSEYEDPRLSASKEPIAAGDPDAELSAPRVLRSEHPKYPPQALYDKVEGDVILTAIIRRDGSVDEVKIEHSIDERLDAAAVGALKHWIFRPSLKNGKPVDVLAEITIPFYLKKVF